MEEIKCPNCGGREFKIRDGLRVCIYCDSKFEVKKDMSSEISIAGDVERLLEKCRKEPEKAARYANLILDIDPSNKEAKKYI